MEVDLPYLYEIERLVRCSILVCVSINCISRKKYRQNQRRLYVVGAKGFCTKSKGKGKGMRRLQKAKITLLPFAGGQALGEKVNSAIKITST